MPPLVSFAPGFGTPCLSSVLTTRRYWTSSFFVTPYGALIPCRVCPRGTHHAAQSQPSSICYVYLGVCGDSFPSSEVKRPVASTHYMSEEYKLYNVLWPTSPRERNLAAAAGCAGRRIESIDVIDEVDPSGEDIAQVWPFPKTSKRRA